MYRRLLARLLHYANSRPPHDRQAFYEVKERLLRKYGRLIGSEWQHVVNECWGSNWDYLDSVPCGPNCRRCGGTGIHSQKWVSLERWQWGRFVFHRPAFTAWADPGEAVRIEGRIGHTDYGRLAAESALWLYLLTGHWRLLWRSLRGSSYSQCRLWPLLNVQRVVMRLSVRLSRRLCYRCDRKFFTWGRGWLICGRCRVAEAETAEDCEVPF